MVYLPENSSTTESSELGASTENIATDSMSNFEQWLAFLFGIRL